VFVVEGPSRMTNARKERLKGCTFPHVIFSAFTSITMHVARERETLPSHDEELFLVRDLAL